MRRRIVGALAAVAAAPSLLQPRPAVAQTAAQAAAQGFPGKPIRWIVPFPPGGPTDGFSRGAAQKLSEVVGQPVIVENVPGAGASIGMERVARAAPDGYTIGLATTGTHAINPHLYGTRLPHDTSRDFTPLTLAVRYVNVLVVNPRLGIDSVGDLIAYAKANPDKVTFGSAGNGSSNHLSGEVLKMVTGAPMQHVPYRGSAPALADVIAGNITFMFDILITAMPSAQAGRVKALAVTSERRSPYAASVPTMAESGVKGFSEAGSDLWFGIVGPAGIPKPVVQKLNESLIVGMRSAEMRQRISASGNTVRIESPQQFRETVKADRARWAGVVKQVGVTID
jgi:tripartite-type tricarboxylate transporter receptor subunit TctC